MPNILKKLNSFTAMRVKYGSYAVIASGGPYTVEYLVIAGGGGAGNFRGGGGGAGGYINATVGETTGGGGSAESVLTLSSGTSYTVTIGGGGAGGAGGSTGSAGTV